MSEPRQYTSLAQVRDNVAVVNAAMKIGGGSYEAAIVSLANFNEQLIHRIIQLESIAPKAIENGDGKVWIWHCPDHLIPRTKA